MADGDFPDHDPLSCPQCALRLLTHAVFLPVSVGFGMSGHSDNSVQAAAAQLGVSPATPSPIDAPTGAVSQPPDPASPSTNANSSPRVLEVGSKRAKRPPKMPVAAPPSSSSIDASSAIDPEKIAACEAFKAQGNALMAQEDYLGAIDAYTAAIDAFPPSASSGEEDPLLAIYYANRALAQQKLVRRFI